MSSRLRINLFHPLRKSRTIIAGKEILFSCVLHTKLIIIYKMCVCETQNFVMLKYVVVIVVTVH